MATTYVYDRNYKYGADYLADMIYGWMGSYDSEDYFERFRDALITKVNGMLPDDMIWFPELSEVWAEVDVDHSEYFEDFSEYFKEILEKAWDLAEAEVEIEEEEAK